MGASRVFILKDTLVLQLDFPFLYNHMWVADQHGCIAWPIERCFCMVFISVSIYFLFVERN